MFEVSLLHLQLQSSSYLLKLRIFLFILRNEFLLSQIFRSIILFSFNLIFCNNFYHLQIVYFEVINFVVRIKFEAQI